MNEGGNLRKPSLIDFWKNRESLNLKKNDEPKRLGRQSSLKNIYRKNDNCELESKNQEMMKMAQCHSLEANLHNSEDKLKNEQFDDKILSKLSNENIYAKPIPKPRLKLKKEDDTQFEEKTIQFNKMLQFGVRKNDTFKLNNEESNLSKTSLIDQWEKPEKDVMEKTCELRNIIRQYNDREYSKKTEDSVIENETKLLICFEQCNVSENKISSKFNSSENNLAISTEEMKWTNKNYSGKSITKETNMETESNLSKTSLINQWRKLGKDVMENTCGPKIIMRQYSNGEYSKKTEDSVIENKTKSLIRFGQYNASENKISSNFNSSENNLAISTEEMKCATNKKYSMEPITKETNTKTEKENNLKEMFKELIEKSTIEKETDTFSNLSNDAINSEQAYRKTKTEILEASKNKAVYCEVNEIHLLDPKKVKRAEGQNVKSKLLIITSNNKEHIVTFKWKGLIDKIFCLGCEIKNTSIYGSNGIIGNKSLFSAENQRGVLIPLNLIGDSCEISGHKKLTIENNLVHGDRICCIESSNKLARAPNLAIGNLIERINTGDRGICRWLGYVNNEETIGVEMNLPFRTGTNGTFSGIKLFDCQHTKGFLFEPHAFSWVSNNIQKTELLKFETNHFSIGNQSNLIEIPNFKLKITNPQCIKLIENGIQYVKSITFIYQGETVWFNLKWKGFINKELHFGCELTFDSIYGTNGTFNDQKIFDCYNCRGVLIPMELFQGSCQFQNSKCTVNHKDIVEQTGFFYFLKNGPVSIQPDSICCVESTSAKGDFEIESKVKYSSKVKNKVGICKWIGHINGQKSIGIEMETEFIGSENLMPDYHIFSSKRNRAALFLIGNITSVE